MPKCINDPKKSYKGTEPSPKGLGYCAHSEKIGSEKKGRDCRKYPRWVWKRTSWLFAWQKRFQPGNDQAVEIQVDQLKYGEEKGPAGNPIDRNKFWWRSKKTE